MLFRNRLFQRAIIASCLFAACVVSIQAEETQSTQDNQLGMTAAMQKSMDPNVWTQWMAMMMNPQNSSAIGSCALCHEGSDVARFQTSYGPMLDAMWQPYKAMMSPQMMTSWMNPNTYMGGMMNPAMYMNMMYPMMGMMGPMMGPMMGSMMNPMGMMNPAMYMNMMYPMMGMMGPMMGGMNMYGGNPMSQPGGQAIDPQQHTQWFDQWSEMMKNFLPKSDP